MGLYRLSHHIIAEKAAAVCLNGVILRIDVSPMLMLREHKEVGDVGRDAFVRMMACEKNTAPEG